jgi:3'(2'), 5'-bisphosphate nucleotidase
MARSAVANLDPADSTELLGSLTALAAAAAQAVLDGRAGCTVRIKADGSPVTPADEAAESIIREGLARLAPGLPIVSE